MKNLVTALTGLAIVLSLTNVATNISHLKDIIANKKIVCEVEK